MLPLGDFVCSDSAYFRINYGRLFLASSRVGLSKGIVNFNMVGTTLVAQDLNDLLNALHGGCP